MSRQLKIAVADDEMDTREYLEEYLTRLDHDVRSAPDGRRLVELCRAFPPDLVVTDLAMPGLDGLAAAAEVNRERRVPVVLISGRQDAEEAALAAAHVVKFLAKPVRNEDLRVTVEAAVRGELLPVAGGA